jgi:hypothetical protein
MQLVLDGAIRISPSRVDAVERQLATVIRLALLREDALRRVARLGRELGDEGFDSRVRPYARMLRGVPEGGRGFLSVVEAMVAPLRRSADVSEVRDNDDDLVRKILSVIARPSRPKRRSSPSGGSGPTGAGPAADSRPRCAHGRCLAETHPPIRTRSARSGLPPCRERSTRPRARCFSASNGRRTLPSPPARRHLGRIRGPSSRTRSSRSCVQASSSRPSSPMTTPSGGRSCESPRCRWRPTRYDPPPAVGSCLLRSTEAAGYRRRLACRTIRRPHDARRRTRTAPSRRTRRARAQLASGGSPWPFERTE